MLYIDRNDIYSQIMDLTDSEKLDLVMCYFKTDLIDAPFQDIARHLEECPEDYKGYVKLTGAEYLGNDSLEMPDRGYLLCD